MATALIGGAFLSASLQVLFERLASQKVIDFFKGRKLNSGLLEKLKLMMISVEGVLDDAEEKQITRRAVRKWLDELKDAFFEADDLLDEIAYAALSSEIKAEPQTSIDKVRKIFSSGGPLEKKIEPKLEEILEKLKFLVDQKSALGLKEGIGEKLSSRKVPTTSVMDESGVCGREEDKEIIVQLLLSDDANCNNLGLIPIVGMGGVGKTTLAQSVYNDSRVEERFEPKAWIYVSEEFDVLKVTRNILNGVSSETMHDFNTLDHFQVELKNQLSDKKFLLVLDDVWNYNYEEWDILLRPLKAGAKGSKIIITTRLQSATSVMEVIQTHQLEKLSDEECWLLFSKHAFDGRSSSAYPNLEEIGREIAKKCDGLPLAAKSLGRLLRSKRKPEEWERVLKNDIWNLPEDNIIPALRLSYHFLPSPLKQCFAYCAILPKGYRFKKEELVLLWMGEGFLGQAGFSMEREVIGEEYFNDLVSRSFFNPNGGNFIMHDLINDLARSVAGEFCFRLDDDNDSCKVTPRTRHLSYIPRKSLLSNNSEAITSAPLLRTFLPIIWRAYHKIDRKVIYDILPKLERLRVLSLFQYRSVSNLHDSIRNLKHLRHLNLSETSIKILPEFLCYLYNLEILLLVHCRNLVELPLNLGNLANLCVLNIEGTHLQKMPQRMGKLMKLQRLSDFVIGKNSGSSIQELRNLQQLRGRLVIRNLENVKDVEEALRANVKGKIHLKELELFWKGDVDDSMQTRCLLEQLEPHENVETLRISGYGGTRFPDWIDGGSPLLGVVKLKLDGCKHFCELPPLGQLVRLKELSITDFPGIVSIGPEFYGRCTSMKKPFQCLEVLRFENMPLWQEWVTCVNEEEVFHLLQELYIINCPAFKQSLPRYLPSLTTLETRGCERLVDLHGLTLSRGRRLSVFRFQDPLPERIEQLGCCGLFDALEEVTIVQVDFLKCFPLESFSNLKHLSIEGCPNFETINGNYISLLSLQISKCPNLVSFPEVGLKTPNLQSLELKQCSNLKWLPESMHSLLYSLEVLVIWNCRKLESFPEGGLPLKLQRLEIVGCTELINGRNRWNLYCLPSPLKFHIGGYKHAKCFPEESLLPPTLISLEISDFQNLKSLEYKGFQHLTSLQSLSISRCPKLQLLLEEGLPSSLICLSICDLQNSEFVVDSKIQQLTNLKELSVSNCPKLKSVSEEGLPSSLTSLRMWKLQNLESVANKIQQLTNLKKLSVRECPKLKSVLEEAPSCLTLLLIDNLQNLESVVNSKIQQLSNLKALSIVNCPKLKSVPEEGLPSTITYLQILRFADLESLNSKGVQSLTSLKKLWICNCPKLQCLPEEGLPSSLVYLFIRSCPLLEKRCERGKGEDWPKISHIPLIDIR